MIVDSSVLVAIIFAETEAQRLLQAMDEAPSVSLGVPTFLETEIVIGGRLGFGARKLHQLLSHFEANLVPFSALHGEEALRAYEKFGKGRHKAALNFGDCMTYAVARLAQEPLLCVGDDFRHSDLALAAY